MILKLKNKYKPKAIDYSKIAQKYFHQSDPKTIERLWLLAKAMRPELEIAPEEDFEFYSINFKLPDELQDKEEAIINFIGEAGLRFGFWHSYPHQDKLRANPFVKKRYNDEIQLSITDPKNFNTFYAELKKFITTHGPTKIFYQEGAGIGSINDRNFKLHTEVKRKVFSELCRHINEQVLKDRILELANFKKGIEISDKLGNNPKRKPSTFTSTTYFMNNLAKELRENTGLNPKQLVNNNGNLTLIGEKVVTPN